MIRAGVALAGLLAIVGLAVALHAALAWHHGGLVAASCRWDCAWYVRIAAHGYAALPQLSDEARLGQGDWAFFPLYPVLVGLVARIAGLDAETAGLVLNVALLPCLIGLCAADLRAQGEQVGTLFVAAFFVLYPFNVWYFSQYSETVFGVALVGAIVALRRGHILAAAVLCCGLGLARPTGFVLAVCIAAYAFAARWSGRGAGTADRALDSVLLVAAAGAGLAAYVVYLDRLTGDGFAFMHVQTAWNRRFRFFVLHIVHAFGHRHRVAGGVAAVAGLVLVAWLVMTGRRLAGLLVGVTLLLACSTGTASIERFVFSNPLVIEVAASRVARLDVRRRLAVMAAMALLQAGVIALWFSGSDVLT